jgi:superfamily II DNA or RNA helicase
VLLPGQQEDVAKTEDRFAKPDGYGMLFTNGTGTGKTYTGLGVIKRFQRQGKTNILIVVPDEKVGSDWANSGSDLGLKITRLADTKDAGKGIVVTTYANLGQNAALASRSWDLVVADEAHNLMKSGDASVTNALSRSEERV